MLIKSIIVIGLLLWGLGASAAEKLYYRYPGVSGNVVIDDRIPPEAVPRGYDVIRKDGSIVKTVAPQLTEGQRKAQAQEAAIARARAEAAQKMREWDESLLLRYSDIADIEVAKQRALNDIKVRISILKSNMRVVKEQVLKNQKEAAELERGGVAVPSSMAETQMLLRRELAATEEQISVRAEQLDTVAEAYERDKARFSVLQEQVDKRRALAQ
jgi:hypothetical protein